jgi:translation elongation factor EF-Tu-like GTPase
MITSRPPDIEAEVSFLPTNQGGKTGSVLSGYRPQHQVMENLQTSGEHFYLNKETVLPGETASANIWFLSPEEYPESIWVGREIEIKEGSHLVGMAKVMKIFNPILESKTKEIKRWISKGEV